VPSPAASPAASPSPAKGAFSAIPKPSLKPGEVITWVKLDRPRLALGEIIVGSFALAGLVLLISMGAGILIGHFRSKRTDTHGTGGLRLR
jgi:hypothetical protein